MAQENDIIRSSYSGGDAQEKLNHRKKKEGIRGHDLYREPS